MEGLEDTGGGGHPAPAWRLGIASQAGPAVEWLARLAEADKENAPVYRVVAAVIEKQAGVEEEALQRLREAGAAEAVAKAARRASMARAPVLEVLGGLPGPLRDEEWLREKLLELARAAMEAGWSPSARAAGITEPVEKALISLDEVLGDVLRGRLDLVDAWAGAVSAPRDEVATLVYWLLQPLLSATRLAAGPSLGWLHSYWQQGRCPVCGAPAAVGYMVGEGRRQVMHCSICHMEWVFPRATCPRCGAQSPGDVVFYQPDEERPWLRLYRCRRCGASWRIVDEEHPGAAREGLPPRLLYDLYTAHLAVLAEKLTARGEQ